ncbi:MAG: hypothetical protein ACLFS9_11715 [Nitriliruptoraceae bacterium]
MSRVHCVACGMAVVIDPQGHCPEGHYVGSRGARVAAAMGSHTAHPEEPEPWVYLIEDLSEVSAGVGAGLQDAARSNGHAGTNGHASTNGHVSTNGTTPAAPRRLRPLLRPSPENDRFDDEPADADELLRELHSLAALEEVVAPPPAREEAPEVPPTPPATTPPPPPAGTTAPRPPRLDRDEMSHAFAELSALDAFAREQDAPPPRSPSSKGSAAGTTPRATSGPAANGRGNGNGPATPSRPPVADPEAGPATPGADELAALFSSELDALGQSSAPGPGTRSAQPPQAAPHEDHDPDQPRPDHAAAAQAAGLDELFAAAVSAPSLRSRERRERAATGEESVREHTGAGEPPGLESPMPRSQPGAAESTAPPTGPETSREPHAAPAGPATPAPGHTPDAGAPPRVAPLDLSSFTAKGGAGSKGAKRRRFGR